MKTWQCKTVLLALTVLMIGAAEPERLRAGGAGRPPDHHAALKQEPAPPRPVAGAKAEMQDPPAPDEALKKLTAEEQAALNRPEGPNGRAKTYARLSEARLKSARAALGREEYAAADEELKVYTALVADAGRYLAASAPRRDRAHKTIEQALREQIRVLEGIRRDETSAHIDVAEKALATAQRIRRQALNSLLGDGKTFLKDPELAEPKKAPEGQANP